MINRVRDGVGLGGNIKQMPLIPNYSENHRLFVSDGYQD